MSVVKGYVLIQAQVGKAKIVADALKTLSPNGAKVIQAEPVTGEYDVVARVEWENIDSMHEFLQRGLPAVDHILRTNTLTAPNI